MSSNQYMVSQVEKRGLARTMEDEIKVVYDPRVTSLAPGHERRPPVFGDALQDRVTGIGWLVLEVQACHKMIEQPAGKHGDAEVRCLHAFSIECDGAWFDRLEPVVSVRCCPRAAKPTEGRIQRCWPLIGLMVIATMRIRLPDFNQRIGDRQPVSVQDTPLDAHALANRLWPGQHVAAGICTQQSGREERARRLRAGQRELLHCPPSCGANGVASGPHTTMSQR